MTDVYRFAASILLLRPCSGGKGHEFLLLHKPRKNDAWQLPQGGIEEGESVAVAALRELHEEAGIAGCKLLGESKKEYTYDFPESFRRFRPDNVRGQHIGFVFAVASQDTVVHVDGKEVDAFVWVSVPTLSQYVKRPAYAELIASLVGEAEPLLQAS